MKPDYTWRYQSETPMRRLCLVTPERLDDLDTLASEPEPIGLPAEVRRYCREWREANGIQRKGRR